MDAADYDAAAKPLTQTEFRDAARKTTEAGQGGHFGFILGGSQLNRGQDAVRNMGRMAGASAGSDSPLDADIDLHTGEYVFDSAQYIAAIELLIAMRDDGSFFQSLMSLNAPQARSYVPEGAAGMILQGPWNIPGWEGRHPEFDFGVASGPVPDSGPTGKLTISQAGAVPNTISLLAGSDNGATAGETFQYLGTVEGQIEWGNPVGAGDSPIMPEAIGRAELSERSRFILSYFNDAIQ